MNTHTQTQPTRTRRSTLAVAALATLSLGFAPPLLAATATPATATHTSPAHEGVAPSANAARKCLSDVHAFEKQMQKEGYWVQGSDLGYGYGYPMDGYGYDQPLPPVGMGVAGSSGAMGYQSARPGYEIRTLVASATILAQRGQQQTCEALLSATHDIYVRHSGELRRGDGARVDGAQFRRERLAEAKPVADSNTSYRSDQLIGTEVLNPQGDGLGSVDDLVLSPQTGKIAYLVVGRGGVFGIDEKYVPVPWGIFKATPGAGMLVLDATKAVMKSAPEVAEDGFSAHGDFAAQSKTVDAYWAAHAAK